MSRSERSRPRGVAVLVGAMIGILALTGCGAGQITETSDQVTAVGGANAGTGSILVREAQIEFGDDVEGGTVYPRGGAAPLRMRIINEGTEADRLVSATSPAASSVRVSGETEVPSGQVLLVEGEQAPAVAPPGTSPAPSTSPAPTSPAPTNPAPTSPAPSAPGAVEGGERMAQIVLTGLRDDIRAGLTYELVLVFERAGEIRFDVPIGNPRTPREPAAE